MARKHKGSTLVNGKEGVFPRKVIEFDLTDTQFTQRVHADSVLRVHQIKCLLETNPEVFEQSNNLVWDTIVTTSEHIDFSLTPTFLQCIYPVKGLELSVNNVLRYYAHETGSVVCSALGSAISVYVDACYKFYIEKTLSEDAFKLMLDAFLSGSGLLTAHYEPLISAASKLTNTKANRSNKDMANFKRKRALEIKLEYEKTYPNRNLSAAWIAKQAARKIENELNTNVAKGEKRHTVSPKTVENYFAENKKSLF